MFLRLRQYVCIVMYVGIVFNTDTLAESYLVTGVTRLRTDTDAEPYYTKRNLQPSRLSPFSSSSVFDSRMR